MLYSGFREGSLRGAANELNVPVIVYEAGEALRFDETSIRAGVRGIVRVMEDLDMLPPRKRDGVSRAPMVLRSSRWVSAPSSGVVRSKQPIGAQIEIGQVLAIVSDPLGEEDTDIRSPIDGVISRPH